MLKPNNLFHREKLKGEKAKFQHDKNNAAISGQPLIDNSRLKTLA